VQAGLEWMQREIASPLQQFSSSSSSAAAAAVYPIHMFVWPMERSMAKLLLFCPQTNKCA
jgi:hypothetical protein